MFDQRELLLDAAERAIRYYESLPRRRVSPTREQVARVGELEESMPDGPCSAREVLTMLDEIGSPASMAMAGPRFFGFVIGGTLPAALAANWVASAWDQATGLYDVTPFTARLEQVTLRWLVDLLGLPPDCGGSFVTGATMANFSGLASARGAVLSLAGWDPESDGLFGAPPINVVVSEEAHPSVTKSLGLLGMGRSRVTRAKTDSQGRIIPGALPHIPAPGIVCVQAGNVNTGAIDPIGEICERVKRPGVWVHVDGAFGMWAAASPETRPLVSGVERADSWAVDGHKWLNVPYDCGVSLVRNQEALRRAMAVNAAYLPPSAERDPCNYTPELSRRPRAVEVWAALRSLGRSGVAELVERCCAHARRFARGLEGAGFEVLNEVVLNQVLVSFGDPEKTSRVIGALQEEGTCWAGGTVWQGRTAMRISLSNWATTDEDVDRSLEVMLRVARD
ncbi:pyridoxal phosphate-dependent decarboxylase family protein [Pseudomonadota bacterium]